MFLIYPVQCVNQTADLDSPPPQPPSASADGSGFNNSRAWWGLSWSAHTHPICLWMGQPSPIPRQLQLTEEGAPRVTESERRRRRTRPSERGEVDKRWGPFAHFMVCSSLSSHRWYSNTPRSHHYTTLRLCPISMFLRRLKGSTVNLLKTVFLNLGHHVRSVIVL